jgi:hypothetical protein
LFFESAPTSCELCNVLHCCRSSRPAAAESPQSHSTLSSNPPHLVRDRQPESTTSFSALSLLSPRVENRSEHFRGFQHGAPVRVAWRLQGRAETLTMSSHFHPSSTQLGLSASTCHLATHDRASLYITRGDIADVQARECELGVSESRPVCRWGDLDVMMRLETRRMDGVLCTAIDCRVFAFPVVRMKKRAKLSVHNTT